MAESIQTLRIMRVILAGVLFMAYWKGLVMTKYLSMLIMHRLRIEAVHSKTSSDVHMSQRGCPNTQRPLTSYAVAKGMTRTATRRSDTAKLTINRFDGVLSLRTMATAVQTSTLPSTVPDMVRAHVQMMMTSCQLG